MLKKTKKTTIKKSTNTSRVKQKNANKQTSQFPTLERLLDEIQKERERMGKKKGRDPSWKLFKYVDDVLRSKELIGLIIWKVSDSDGQKASPGYRSINYLYEFFEIEEAQRTADINKRLLRLDEKITETIKNLQVLIESGLQWVVQRFPKKEGTGERSAGAAEWIFDVFGNEARMYLPNWDDFNMAKRSKNKPDYKYSLYLFREFLRGANYKSLGLIEKRKVIQQVYNNIDFEAQASFRTFKQTATWSKRTRPQGLIKLLHTAHAVIYDTPKIIEKAVEEATRPRFLDTFRRLSTQPKQRFPE